MEQVYYLFWLRHYRIYRVVCVSFNPSIRLTSDLEFAHQQLAFHDISIMSTCFYVCMFCIFQLQVQYVQSRYRYLYVTIDAAVTRPCSGCQMSPVLYLFECGAVLRRKCDLSL